MHNNNLKILINSWSVDMVSNLAAAMKASGSRELYNQIEYKGISEQIDLIISKIDAPIGVYYMSEGRPAGSFPPLQDIKKWILLHNIQPLEGKHLGKINKITSPDEQAYQIAKHIADFGTKLHAKHFLEKFQVTPEYKSRFMTAYREDVKKSLQDIADRLNS